MISEYKPLPQQVMDICRELHAPPRLVAHLTLVHDVAFRLVSEMQETFPNLGVDADSVFFGAATHDIGKWSTLKSSWGQVNGMRKAASSY